METHVKKWGNSLGLRIPGAIAAQVDIIDGAKVDIRVRGNKIEVVPVKKQGFDLKDMLKNVNDGNLHSETDTGEPQGAEIW